LNICNECGCESASPKTLIQLCCKLNSAHPVASHKLFSEIRSYNFISSHSKRVVCGLVHEQLLDMQHDVAGIRMHWFLVQAVIFAEIGSGKEQTLMYVKVVFIHQLMH